MSESQEPRQKKPRAPKVRAVRERLGVPPATRADNLLEWLYELRDYQREHQGKGAWLIKGKDLPWEHNRQGKMQWYLHPALEDTSIRSMIFFRQEIPPGGRTGAQKTPGGSILYILEGRGYTILNGTRHQWKAGDIVNLPLLEEGCTYQHFNADQDAPVLMVGCYANHLDAIGVDMGSGFEELEPAPEYRQQHP